MVTLDDKDTFGTKLISALNTIGKIAMIVKNVLPTTVSLDNTLLTYFSVSLPGRIPGI